MSFQNQPLGTVIASVLDFDKLCKSMGERAAFIKNKSTYAPCDGRDVDGSALHELTDKRNAPDLRGKFLRGLDLMYNPGQPETPFDPVQTGDPDTHRLVGSYQADALAKHAHQADYPVFVTSNVGSGGGASVAVNVTRNPTSDVGDIETRPRNICFFFYIKIN